MNILQAKEVPGSGSACSSHYLEYGDKCRALICHNIRYITGVCYEISITEKRSSYQVSVCHTTVKISAATTQLYPWFVRKCVDRPQYQSKKNLKSVEVSAADCWYVLKTLTYT